MKLKSMISWALIFSSSFLLFQPMFQAQEIAKYNRKIRIVKSAQAIKASDELLVTPDNSADSDEASTEDETDSEEGGVLDYSQPDFSGQSFVFNNSSGDVSITHKFKFGTASKSVVYNMVSSITEQTLSSKHSDLILNSKFPGGKIDFFIPSREDRFGDPTLYLTAIKKSETEYSVIGLFDEAASTYKKNVWWFTTNKCETQLDINGHKLSAKLVGRATGRDDTTSDRCLYDPVETYDLSNSGDNIMITDKNYLPYVRSLNDLLSISPVKTTLGTGSANIKPSDDAINQCANTNFSGPINKIDPEYYKTLLNELAGGLKDSGQRDKLKDFLNKGNIKLSAKEDMDLYQAFYAGAGKTSTTYAGVYMNDAYYSKLREIVNKMNTQQAFVEIDKDPVWFESVFTKIAVMAGAVKGGQLAYRAAVPIVKSWLTTTSASTTVATNAAIASNTLAAASSSAPQIINSMGAAYVQAGSGLLVPATSEAAVATTATGGAALIALPVLIVAIVGVIAAAGIIYFYEKNKSDDILNLAHEGLKLLYALEYINKNMLNQQCTGKWAENPDQEEIYNQAKSLFASTFPDVQNTLATASGWWSDDSCPDVRIPLLGGLQKDAIDPFAWALCNILKFFFDIGFTIFSYANCLLEKAIGVGVSNDEACIFKWYGK